MEGQCFRCSGLESEVNHVFRKANSCADMLYSLNLQQDNLVIFPTTRILGTLCMTYVREEIPRTCLMMLILCSSLLSFNHKKYSTLS